MEYEWDEAKHVKNLRERGIGFSDAAQALNFVIDVWEDKKKNYGEKRMFARCRWKGRILIVIYTDRGTFRRIISSRYAHEKERREL